MDDPQKINQKREVEFKNIEARMICQDFSPFFSETHWSPGIRTILKNGLTFIPYLIRLSSFKNIFGRTKPRGEDVSFVSIRRRREEKGVKLR